AASSIPLASLQSAVMVFAVLDGEAVLGSSFGLNGSSSLGAALAASFAALRSASLSLLMSISTSLPSSFSSVTLPSLSATNFALIWNLPVASVQVRKSSAQALPRQNRAAAAAAIAK